MGLGAVHPDTGNDVAAGPSEREWRVVLVGFALMYLPVYWRAAQTIWQTEEHAHGALILVVVGWLLWTLREPMLRVSADPRPGVAWPLFAFGVLLYLCGRVLGISSAEFASQIAVAVAMILLIKGVPALRLAWFPVCYLIFTIPLPATLVDAITAPLKQAISDVVVGVLYSVGYPIARQGVIISIGQYQLLVADACSGLHSMFSLSALGTLCMYIMARARPLHNVLMLLSILPIAFAANIVRVLVLVLVTYHFGDEAGQGFLHGAAGLMLMLVSLACFLALDRALNKLFQGRSVVTVGRESARLG